MNYSINLGSWGSIFAVPASVVDEHLKTANPVYLKVLLFMLRNNGEKINAETVAKSVGADVSEVADGVTYWITAGILKLDGDGFAPNERKKQTTDENNSGWNEPAVVASAENKTAIKEKKILSATQSPRPTHFECADLLSKTPELQSLVQEAQSALGKLLSRTETDTLVSLYSWAGMPIDVILMAIYYCVGIDKKNMRYIEKVVLNWADMEIDTARKADEHLKTVSLKKSAWNKVSSIVGISQRKPSAKEEEMCNKWVNVWHFEDGAINYAFECCVNNTGKMSLTYINKVLESWNAAGITTAEEAKQFSNKKSEKKPTLVMLILKRIKTAATIWIR